MHYIIKNCNLHETVYNLNDSIEGTFLSKKFKKSYWEYLIYSSIEGVGSTL